MNENDTYSITRINNIAANKDLKLKIFDNMGG